MTTLSDQTFDKLKQLRADIPHLANLLNLPEDAAMTSWMNIVDGKLLPRLSPDFPLTVTICGGGSTGKSTLFNSITRDRISPSGGRAGINRRILISAPSEIFRHQQFLSTLFEPFGSESRPLRDQIELTIPGCPLYVLNSSAPRNMVLIDTPDFDTGAKGAYTNREVVRQALEASDILIYIFTNASYNNLDNTDFIAQMLTGIGVRKCFLIYRADASLDNRQVLDHARTVGKNIYGAEADQHILGIYRTDEDNAVAAQQKFMDIRPVAPTTLAFDDALKQLDPRTLRPELLESILKDSLHKASEFFAPMKQSVTGLQQYRDALYLIQSRCARDALKHFPMNMALKRFVEIWMSGDPLYVRAMRTTGTVIGYPVKLIASAVSWLIDRMPGPQKLDDSGEFKDAVTSDLTDAAHTLRQALLSDALVVDSDRGAGAPAVPTPAAVLPVQEQFRNKDWNTVLDAILSHKPKLLALSEGIETDLVELAKTYREKMSISGKLRQTLCAFLNILPATVAVTYVIHTGDIAGASGLKVKLSSMFGLHDLYALVAIPVTTGLSKADRSQLEELLGPIAQAWLNDKLRIVQEVFEQEMTGETIQTVVRAIEDSEQLIAEIDNILKQFDKLKTDWKGVR